jgi:HAD superfamily hydrolase (TIGR01459 family)
MIKCVSGLRNVVVPAAASTASGKPFRYDAVLLDQYGVLHDGTTAYPTTMPCLRELADRKIKMVLISNTCQPAETTLSNLTHFGIDASLFTGAITGGGLVLDALRHRHQSTQPFWKQLGHKCIHVKWADSNVIEFKDFNVNIEEVSDPTDADFVLVSGMDQIGKTKCTPEDLKELVKSCASRKLPMVCGNPDFYAQYRGNILEMPGLLAKQYTELGGVVRQLGKPDASVYDAAVKMLGYPSKERVLAVGDSIAHDVRGASLFGIDSAFICSGIEATELGVEVGTAEKGSYSYQLPPESKVLQLARLRSCPPPTYALPHFEW